MQSVRLIYIFYSILLFSEETGSAPAGSQAGRIEAADPDRNDNHPVFALPEYRRELREGDTEFEPGLVVRTTDRDGPLQGGGTVFYSLQSINTDAPVFKVDPMTGEVSMTKPVRAEDTESGRYDLVVRATDQGKPPLHTDVKVFVEVGTSRNQRPRFAQPRYDIAIRENAAPNSPVIAVTAEDPDGPDSALSTVVRVPVEDVNTQPPVLAQPSYTAYVLENKPRGHTVLTASASRNQRPRFSQPHYDIPIRENAADPEGNPSLHLSTEQRNAELVGSRTGDMQESAVQRQRRDTYDIERPIMNKEFREYKEKMHDEHDENRNRDIGFGILGVVTTILSLVLGTKIFTVKSNVDGIVVEIKLLKQKKDEMDKAAAALRNQALQHQSNIRTLEDHVINQRRRINQFMGVDADDN